MGAARCPLNTTSSRVLVPPRPNLGPEPWIEPRSVVSWIPAAGLIVAVSLTAAVMVFRRRRRPVQHVSQLPIESRAVDGSPGTRLLRLAALVRQSLESEFGPSVRARTTEEIAADAQIKEALGEDRLDPLIHLLALADQWKFATVASNGREESLR